MRGSLHGNPGGESGEKPCGRANPSWSFSDWRREEALRVLRIVAERYKGYPCVAGIQVGLPATSLSLCLSVSHKGRERERERERERVRVDKSQ